MEKYLLPVDDSEESIKAVNYAIDIATNTGAALELVYVLPLGFPPTVSEELFPIPRSIEELMEEEGRKVLARLASQPHKQVSITSRLEKGDVSEAILNLAKRGQYKLIVMGSKGLNWINRYFFGRSVSREVTQHAPCPVLVVH